MIDYALNYAEHGLKVFPLKGKKPLTGHGCKDASSSKDQVEKWWADYPSANIGIATGSESGVVVIDIDQKPDLGEYGEESLKTLEEELGTLPDTWEVLTGSGGRHLYFRYPEGHEVRNSASVLADNIDVRGQGGYIVAPPSIHPDTHNPYVWESSGTPSEVELADLPETWLQRMEKGSYEGKAETLGEGQARAFEMPSAVAQGSRNDTLFRYGASLRAKAVGAVQTLQLMKQFNDERCNPPISSLELQRIYDSVMRYQAGTPENEIKNLNTENSNQNTGDLSQFHHFNKQGVPTSVYDYQIFRYLAEKGGLFILGGVPYEYEHGYFRADLSGARLKTEIRSLIYPELIKSTTIDRVYKLFISDAGLQRETSELNHYPQHWINFRNGFYDPISLRMIPHDENYLSLNQIPHEFHPEADLKGEEVERWLQFITPAPDDREMLLEFMGLCLTRDTRQQKFLILYGSGGSGKSTLIRLLESMIGTENISNISLKELSQRFASYGLLGKLLNSCADLETEALTDTSVIKKVLGEDSLRGEKKGCDAVSFKNYARLIFSTNELPLAVGEKTNGFFRRLLILKMDRQPEHKNTQLLDQLQTEIDYLIQLSVKALERMYQRGTIIESKSSIEAVQSLRNDSDTVEAWINDKCSRDRKSREERGKLYSAYSSYCETSDRQALSRNGFYRSMRMKDFREIKSGDLRYFEGISLRKTALENCPQDASGWVSVDDMKDIPFH